MKTSAARLRLSLGIMTLLLTTAGCASFATSKSTPLTDDVINSHRGDFEGLYAIWIKPQIHLESGSGAKYGKMDVTDLDTQRATERAISKDFERFCTASGGTLDAQPNKYGQKNVCTDANGFLGEIETSRFVEGLAIKVDSKERRKRREQEAQAAADAQKQRDYQRLASESVSLPDLNRLISEFEHDDPQNLLPKAKERQAALLAESMRAAAERDRQHLAQLQAAHEAKLKAQENRQIGDQVCHDAESVTIGVPTGVTIMGQEQYRKITGSARVVGFVEAVNRQNSKIKIRISAINFSSKEVTRPIDSLSHFKGGITLKPDSIIWDDTHDWDGC